VQKTPVVISISPAAFLQLATSCTKCNTPTPSHVQITLDDIATKAGVSVSTVSRVFNKNTTKYRISAETAERVLQVAKELNYQPNQIARGLRLRQTRTIGLIVPDISNPFFAYVVRSIQKAAHKLGYTLVVCDTDESLDLEIEHIDLLKSKGIDGLIIMPVGQEYGHIEQLLTERIPIVLLDRCFDGFETNCVVIDNHHGAYEAIEHLIEHGHRRIAIIQGLPHTYTNNGRLHGYRDALTHHNIPIDENLIVGSDFRKENGYIETKLLLRLEHPPTAIFATSDLITFGALQAISEEGLKIPADISLVAFDDIDFAMSLTCPITAVAQPKESMGEMAVKLLVDHIKGREKKRPKRFVLKPRLIVRASVGPAPSIGHAVSA
jgi:LacI family transcriptional regulator